MADNGNTPNLPGNTGGNNMPKLPGSGGGRNPLEKKEYDILDPEAKPESKANKGVGGVVDGAKKSFDKIKNIIKFIKSIPPQILIVILIIIIVIYVIGGFIGFFLFMPGFIMNGLKQFAQSALDCVQNWFLTNADAYINEEDVINLANYIEEMEYDLVGYGFITPNSNYAEDHEYLDYTELLNNGYIYFERRGDDENARYYNEAGEAYIGSYYNSLGILVDNSTGEIVTGEYTDQFGIRRSTEEYSNSGAGKIVDFGSDYASIPILGNTIDRILGWNVDTKLLRTYLLSDYTIYSIRNNDSTLLKDIFNGIKKTFGGYDAAWSKGLLKFYYSKNGIADIEWSNSLANRIVYGRDISITRTSTGAKMSIKNGHFNNPTIFTIDGWSDRYGMSLEFLLSLHLATMQPDLVYAMLQSFDTEVQVYLDDSGKSTVDAAYVDMLNSEASVNSEDDRITLNDVKTTLSAGGFHVAEFTINDNWATEWVNGLAITRTNAQYLLTYLPLESPDNCTGKAQEQVMLLGTRSNDFMAGSTKLLYGYGLGPNNEEASIWDFVVDYASYEYMVPGVGTYSLETNMFTSGEGGNFDRLAIEILPGTNDNVMSDDYSYFLDNPDMVELSNFGYSNSNISVSTEKKDLEDKTYDTNYINTVYDEESGEYRNQYNTYRIREVVTTREWTSTARGTDANDIIDENIDQTEEVRYSLITYKYMIYDSGVDTRNEQTGEWYGNENDGKSIDELQLIDTLVCEFVVRDKIDYELEQAGLLNYDEETGEYIAQRTLSETKCSNKYTIQDYQKGAKCCNNCKKYVASVINALGAVSDQDYASYTPYIARVLGSWFRDTYFIIPEEEDAAIKDYAEDSEVKRNSAEMQMIENSYGDNARLVVVDEEYLAETGEYWTKYKMKKDESGEPTDEYQLYYLKPDGTTSDIKMEDFRENPYSSLTTLGIDPSRYNVEENTKYGSQDEAEEAGHAFVKKAETRGLSELSSSSLEDVLWSAYEFNSSGSSTGWIKIEPEDGNDAVNNVYDIVGEEYPNSEGGFYYNITSTNKVTQVEDAQRSETNPTVKWLFKYRKYYTYDGSEETALRIAADKSAVLKWAEDYLEDTLGLSASNVARTLAEYGRSALRQGYNSITVSFDWEDVAEEWLDWQLDMYYSGIISCSESDYKLGSLAFIVTTDDDGNITSINETTNLDYQVGENQELRIGDPRNPSLIKTTNITKTSLEAFTILENTKTLAAEYSYRDFKELVVELDYFDKEDLSEAVSSVFTWVLPEVSPAGWPIRPFDKQDTEYGALIESHGTYEALGVVFSEGSSGADVDESTITFIGDSWISGLNCAESSYLWGASGRTATYFLDNFSSVSNYVHSDTSAIVICLGMNNPSSCGKTQELIGRLKQEFPNIPIYNLAVVHIAEQNSTSVTNEQIDSYNQQMRNYCSSTNGVTYINPSDNLVGSDGWLKPEYSGTGGYHLNSAGYEVWYDNIINGIGIGGSNSKKSNSSDNASSSSNNNSGLSSETVDQNTSSQKVGSSNIPSTAQSRLQETYTTSGTADAILNNISKYGGDSNQQSTMSIEEIKSLGGIFEKYADYNNSGKNDINYTVTTAEEFKEVNEYVFGLMTIFGFDYGNGSVNHRFGSLGAGASQESAIFGTSFAYYDSAGLSYSYKPIEEILSDSNNPRRGNCNVTADVVYYAAGLLPMNWVTCSEKRIINAGGKEVTNVEDLQVSDLIMCYNDEGKWYHVKWVGEIDENGNITVYDGGSYYNNHGGDFKIENQNEDLKQGLASGHYKIWHLFDLNGTAAEFQGYEGGEYVSSPVTGKVIEYGTHERINVYTEDTEEVGYIVIEALKSENGFTAENVANNSADTEGMENKDVANALNLFYEEYKDTCAGYTIIIDGFKVDLNTTDDEGNNGTYEQNEVFALYNTEEQRTREANEQAKDDAPFFINYNGGADLGSLPETYINGSNSSTGYYIKEGKYLGVTYTDEESAALTITTDPVEPTDPESASGENSDPSVEDPEVLEDEHTGPANYIRIIVKDKEYSIIDNVEDYFDIPEPTEEISRTGEYGDLEAINETSTDAEKVRAAMTYFVSQGFTPESAAGIMGNLIQESNLDPTAVSDYGYHGLAQWNTSDNGGHWWDAADGIRAWIISQGYNETDYAGQIRAIYEANRRGQMTEALWAELKALTNIEQATELFAVYYEGCEGGSDPTQWYNPGTNYQELNLRKRYAQNAYNIYMGDDSIGIKD